MRRFRIQASPIGTLNRRVIFAALLLCSLSGLTGCGAALRTGLAMPALSPAASTVSLGARIAFSATGSGAASACVWGSSDPAVLTPISPGVYQGEAVGSATASLQCEDAAPVTALVQVAAPVAGPITITRGGSYTGIWQSNDPTVPAVRIATDDPVTLHDAVISGRGDLIEVTGTSKGANLTVSNVTGTALDPGVAGLQRGSFLSARKIVSLNVQHCTMIGVSFGVKVLSSTLSALTISKNSGSNLEDRTSDGSGGLTTTRPDLGHFIFLNQSSVPAGADIGWNQMINNVGSSSVEDVINIYKSQGASGSPIHVHDNYLEGYSSPSSPRYTGTGIIADGNSASPVTAFVTIEANQMVHAAGSGVEIANGHDITVRNNHVVSCGKDAQGHWIAMPFINGIVVWNYYGAPQFFNNTVQGTRGGMVRPAADGTPAIADLWARSTDLNATDSMGPNAFTDPCMASGQLPSQAEDAERSYWAAKLASAGIVPGDTHTP